MSELFQNNYRIKSARHPNWDYRLKSYYFITICTKNRINYFGEIIDHKIHLSKIGQIVKFEWLKTGERNNVILDEWVIMPDHFHCIVQLKQMNSQMDGLSPNHKISTENASLPDVTPMSAVETLRDVISIPVETLPVETLRATSLQQTIHQRFSRISPKPNSISTIIRSFKSAVTKSCHDQGLIFQWQERFYDMIIRDEIELYFVRQYIKHNVYKHGCSV